MDKKNLFSTGEYHVARRRDEASLKTNFSVRNTSTVWSRGSLLKFIPVVAIFLGFFIFSYSFNSNFKQAIPLIGDEPSYMAIADSIAHFRTVNLAQEKATQRFTNFFSSTDPNDYHTVDIGNNKFPKHGIGWPILMAPFFWLKSNPRFLEMILQNVIVSLLAVNVYLWVREQKFKSWIALIVAGTIVLCLPIAVETHFLFSEPLAALSLVYAVRKFQSPNFLSMLAIAYLPWIHFKYLAFSLVLLLPFLNFKANPFRLEKKQKWYLFLPVILSFIILMVFNQYAYHSLLSGQEKSSSFGSNYQGLMGLWVDHIDGLLTFAPIYLLSFLGLGVMAVSKKKTFWLIIILVGILWLTTGVFSGWDGGQAPTGRMLMAVLPLFALPLAEVLTLPFNFFFKFLYAIFLLPSLLLAFWGRIHPVYLIEKNSFASLNILRDYFSNVFDYQHLFPSMGEPHPKLIVFWIFMFIFLFVSGLLIAKYRSKLEKLNEIINHNTGI